MNDTPRLDDDPEDLKVRALVKRATAAAPKAPPNLLAGIQRRIRHRSRGKFFADGWSTTQARTSYALIGILTLLLVSLAYFVLGPIDMR